MNKMKLVDIKTLQQLIARMEKLKEKDTYFLKCGYGENNFNHVERFFSFGKKENGDIKVYIDKSYAGNYCVRVRIIKKETIVSMCLENSIKTIETKQNKIFKI